MHSRCIDIGWSVNPASAYVSDLVRAGARLGTVLQILTNREEAWVTIWAGDQGVYCNKVHTIVSVQLCKTCYQIPRPVRFRVAGRATDKGLPTRGGSILPIIQSWPLYQSMPRFALITYPYPAQDGRGSLCRRGSWESWDQVLA